MSDHTLVRTGALLLTSLVHMVCLWTAMEEQYSVRILAKGTTTTQVTFLKLHSKHTNKQFYKLDI